MKIITGLKTRPSKRAWPLLYKPIETLGYETCDNAELEAGFEKVAIYAHANRLPTHAAKQLPSGLWSSKIGRGEDIEHNTLESLAGRLYGDVAQILKRPT